MNQVLVSCFVSGRGGILRLLFSISVAKLVLATATEICKNFCFFVLKSVSKNELLKIDVS